MTQQNWDSSGLEVIRSAGKGGIMMKMQGNFYSSGAQTISATSACPGEACPRA
jgi:hypothetical protein